MRWLLLKDLQILRRSPLLVTLLVLYPIVIAALVGFAATSGPDKPRVAVLNEVPSSANKVNLGGEEVNLAEESKPLFDAIERVDVDSRDEAIQKVRDGDVLAALILPADITSKLQTAASGGGAQATVEVFYNAEDPAKRAFVENTIKARVQEANTALTRKVTQVALDYLNLIKTGGQFSFLGRSFDVLGLDRAAGILRDARSTLPRNSPLREQLSEVIRFAELASQNLDLAQPLLKSVGTPLQVRSTVVKGSEAPLATFAVAIAATVTLMFITLLLASGMLALEREENAFSRLVRGLVSKTGLLVEKVGLAAICSTVVGLLLLAGLSLFVKLPWGRFPLWLVALLFGAAAFGALGVAIGALAREVRAASLLAFMASLPIAVLGLVPSGTVSGGLYDLIRVVSGAFPFRPTLEALNAALASSGDIALPLLHLALLTVAFTLLARLALRRFAA